MPTITIDGKQVECRDGIPVLQAAIEAGWDVPYYCYHPGLSVVASCRMCLMEMQMPNPKTGDMGWAPRLFPSCQTPVRNGLVVRFDSKTVAESRAHCLEYFLINHPLDCPVCDKAGECYLQDYSYEFGEPTSRMVDQKLVNPKKDIGPKTLLYSDRCVLCTRCVRFTSEISGTGELCLTNRGSRSEIDVFPGVPLDNLMQGNVVDICPVGALLDKDFLFRQRVWMLQPAPSICPGCSRGCAVWVDANDNGVHRLKPRFNPGVNDWWMCDEGRFGWKYIHDPARITRPLVRRGVHPESPDWASLPEILSFRFREHVAEHGSAGVVCLLSPMMANEEAWLLVRFLGQVAPEAKLVLGPIPVEGQDASFPVQAKGDGIKFTVYAEKCPNRRGVERVIEASSLEALEFGAFVKDAAAGKVTAAWVVGGYPKKDWASKDFAKAAEKIKLLVTQELFGSPLTPLATVVLPACAFAERDGSFTNCDGVIQPFKRAIHSPEGCRRDGQFLYELSGGSGVFNPARVRQQMAATMEEFNNVHEAPPEPAHQH